jgi:pilus assembly protein CpaB
MMVSAALFGLLAVFLARSWLSHQDRVKTVESRPVPVATRNVVVASVPLRFGQPLVSQNLREVSWPDGAVPAGTFTSINDLLAPGKRIVLSAIEPNEPILAAKVTGQGQKATLSAIIQDGMKAATIRVGDVEGVAGFVLPGDHVDVLVTRRQGERAVNTTDLVLQNVRVLAVDQLADDAAEKPMIAKAVTLEVDTNAAQRLSLAASIGALSLTLRKAGEQMVMDGARRITLNDLDSPYTITRPSDGKGLVTVTVTRGAASQDYSVPAEGPSRRETIGAQGTTH